MSLPLLTLKHYNKLLCRLQQHRRMFSSSLTAEEAGREAERLAKEYYHYNAGTYTSNLTDVDDPPSTMSSISTLLSHSGIELHHSETNIPMSPPIHTATTYTRPADGNYKDGDSIYSRMDNPTRLLLERTIFDLECINIKKSILLANNKNKERNMIDDVHNKTSFAFSSGLAGVTAIILAHSLPLTVLIPNDIYHGVSSLLSDVFINYKVTTRTVDMRQIGNVINTILQIDTTTRHNIIVWMETPSNPKCHVIDIQGICNAIQHEFNSTYSITTVVDGTLASPILSRPLELGADISFHSGTKYLAGHSDALLGIVTVSPLSRRVNELTPALKSAQILGGGVASPWDSWLTLRGMRTLHVRIKQQCETAQKLVEYLRDRKDLMMPIKAIHYPSLACHPQHELASRQMQDGYGGVFSFEFDDEVKATAFAGALHTIQRATSLGGTETLIEHRASIEPPTRKTSPAGLLRVSVGLEHIDDLIQDFETAFYLANKVFSES